MVLPSAVKMALQIRSFRRNSDNSKKLPRNCVNGKNALNLEPLAKGNTLLHVVGHIGLQVGGHMEPHTTITMQKCMYIFQISAHIEIQGI